MARATAAWEKAYWASLPEWEHQIITDARPTLYACFNRADLLISDVSSVISDFLASGEAVRGGQHQRAVRGRLPGGVPDGGGGDGADAGRAPGCRTLLDAVRHPERDELAEARAELKRRLLGPAEPSSQERFNEAVQALCGGPGPQGTDGGAAGRGARSAHPDRGLPRAALSGTAFQVPTAPR